jgi:tRNA pseudouridine38-40 synthase
MARAARHFEGTHDFAALQSSGSEVGSTQRTVLRCELLARDGGLELFVEGTGFLRHMVRTLAGTLLEVGAGRRAPDSIPELLARADRGLAGPTAPACGLTLVAVRYGSGPESAAIRFRP